MLRLSRAQLREVDRISIEEYGLPGIVLMENAARSAGEILSSRKFGDGERKALIVCGGGNNGGDGFAVAGLLHNEGWGVSIIALKPMDEHKGDARIMADVALKMRIPTSRDVELICQATEGIV